jgi:hypothetical protein|tara:strand:- start:3747 stop:4427 length:681 start_codon:yes stop_codon:yes gene_type:complete
MVEHLSNDTKTWMFGTTSDFSKEIIKNLDNPICFGRHNVDYDDPDKFIKEHVVDNTPVNMVINVGLNNNNMLPTDSMQTLSVYKKYFMDITTNIFFFFRLLDEMNTLKIPVRVCYVTSTFANTRWYNRKEKMRPNIYVNNHKREKDHVFKYSTVRLIQQSAMNSNISETCRVVGVNPARLEEDDNITLYALKISEMVNKPVDDEQWNRVHCLSGPTIYSQPMWEEE